MSQRDSSLPIPTASPTPAPRPYHDAPRLPEGEVVDVHSLVSGGFFELEIGPGRGGFVFERAAAEPNAALIGLEVRRKWATIVDNRLRDRGLSARARVFAEDAKSALPRLGPDGVLRRVFVHFPDPWWKKRHQKRLLLEGSVLDEVARLIEPGGELFIQTDVAERAEQYAALVDAHPRFKPAGDNDSTPALVDHPYVARSPREHRAIADGLPVFRLRYRRC